MTNNNNKSKAVILFHAFTGTPNDVLTVGRALEREGYEVRTPTLSGHGEDDPDILLNYGIKDWIKDGDHAYNELKEEGYTDISVFGLSLGGIIATHVMLNHDVKSYGVFSSPVIANERSNVPKNFLQWYGFKKKKLGLNPDEIKALEPEVTKQLTEILTGINEYVEQMMPEYANIDLPVFIGQGGKDEMIDQNLAYEFRDSLKNARVSFHWYEDAPHVITIGQTGVKLRGDLIEFLKENG